MILLQPPIETIERAYAAWLGKSTVEPVEADSDSELLNVAELKAAGFDTETLPDFVSDAIDRQLQARPILRAPQVGDLIVLAPPHGGDECIEPQQPVAIVLDAPEDRCWTGWLVGSHIDYAGDRDLVVDATLLEKGIDPAPLAGMVMSWNRVALRLPAEAHVLHRLTPQALEAVRTLARQTQPPETAPAPGRMCTRELNDQVIVTGTPYLRDDPRTSYLRLTRELARRISVPEYDDQGAQRRLDHGDPEP